MPGTITIKEIAITKLLLSEHYADIRLKNIPRLSVKRTYLFSPRALALVTGLRFGTHLEATEVFTGNIVQGMPSLHPLILLIQLTSMSQKGIYPCF